MPDRQIWQNPGITCPVYIKPEQAIAAFEKCGNSAIHRMLAGQFGQQIWSESTATFAARIMTAINDPPIAPILFNLDTEAMIVLYYLHHKGLASVVDIPFGEDAWRPPNG